ncbi:MAG: hypothetical protein KF819_33580 [Labilithrix sp.]|nr:hypothetical protein [Labilithrix sp.]
MQIRTLTSFALLLAATGCAGYDASSGTDGEGTAGEAPPSGATEAPKAAPVTGTPNDSELTEAFGVFVSNAGRDDGAGDRESPFATIGAGIARATQLGKRVYVCAGTFAEQITVADSISIIGGLDCSRPDWKLGMGRSRIQASASPALRADDITSPTRLERLEIIAPDADAPSASSIGLLANRSPGITLVGSRVQSGNGAKGADGVDAVQLMQAGTLNGANGSAETTACSANFCSTVARNVNPGGTSVCAGADGHNGESGGYGGTGGLYDFTVNAVWVSHNGQTSTGAQPRTGGAAAKGIDGASAAAASTLSAEGYSPVNGLAGTDGAPGKGGLGGNGVRPLNPIPRLEEGATITRWYGNSGAGGGAGGCPGLAGTPGGGGGASIAVLVIGAPLTVESSELIAKNGGDGGRGTFGSSPTPGGRPGLDVAAKGGTGGYGGGAGGAAGVSGSGAGGPSYGLAFTETAPTMSATTAKAGLPGNGVEQLTSVDLMGNAKTILASAAGVAEGIMSR